jgi:hypothetical protein
VDLSSVFTETDHKVSSVSICSDHSKNAQFAIYRGDDSVASYTPVRRTKRSNVLTCGSTRSAADISLHSGNVRACAK